MQRILSKDPSVTPTAPFHYTADRWLPAWARRDAPIIRQQLGVFWKVMTPEPRLVLRLFAVQTVLLLVSMVFPGVFNLLLPIVTVPVVLLPILLYYYGQTLLRIGIEAASVIAEDLRGDRITLLRMTPIPLWQLVASKSAAAIWRHVETLDLLLTGSALLSMPMVVVLIASAYPPDDYGVVSSLMMISGFAVSLLRVLLEPVMLAALGLLMGSATRERIPAMLATSAAGFAYFALINLARGLPLDPLGRLMIESVLPLLAPLLITAGSLAGALHLLQRD